MRGTAGELAARYAAAEPRGEVVLVVGGAPAPDGGDEAAVDAVRRLVGVGRARPGGGGGRGGADGRAGERALQGRRRALTRDMRRRPGSPGCGRAATLRRGRSYDIDANASRGRPRPLAALYGRRVARRISALCNDSAPTQRRSAQHPADPAATRHLGSARAPPPRPRSLFPSRLRSPQSWPRSWRRWRFPPPPWPSDGCDRSPARWRARSTTRAARRSPPARTAASTSPRRRARRSGRPAPAASSTPAGSPGAGGRQRRAAARGASATCRCASIAVRAGARGPRGRADRHASRPATAACTSASAREGDPFGYVDPMTLLPGADAPRAGRGRPRRGRPRRSACRRAGPCGPRRPAAHGRVAPPRGAPAGAGTVPWPAWAGLALALPAPPGRLDRGAAAAAPRGPPRAARRAP